MEWISTPAACGSQIVDGPDALGLGHEHDVAPAADRELGRLVCQVDLHHVTEVGDRGAHPALTDEEFERRRSHVARERQPHRGAGDGDLGSVGVEDEPDT